MSLWSDLDGRTVWYQFPDFVYLGIRDRDASIGPISCAMGRADHAIAIRQSVDHDVAAGGTSFVLSFPPVLLIGIRNVNGLVKLALRIPPVERVGSFGSLVISLLFLGADWIRSQSDLVCANDFAPREEGQRVLALYHDNLVGLDRADR